MSNKSNKLCTDSDNSTKPLQITRDHKQTNEHKRTTKISKTRSDYFYGRNIPYRTVNV